MCFLGPKITPSSNFLELERIIYNIVTHKVPRGMFVLPALSQTRLPCLSRAGEVLSHMLPWLHMSSSGSSLPSAQCRKRSKLVFAISQKTSQTLIHENCLQHSATISKPFFAKEESNLESNHM